MDVCSPLTQFELLHSKFYHCSMSTRQLLLSTYVKFINLFQEIKPQILEVINAKCMIEEIMTFALWAWCSSPLIPSLSPRSTLSFSIFYFSLLPFLHPFSCFSISSHFTRIVPLRF